MAKTILISHCRFVLLDANVVAGNYLPESLNSKKARERIQNLITSARKGACPEIQLFIPNFCIAEVFAVFAKYSFSKWNRHVKKNLPGGLDTRKYKSIRKAFRADVHNGLLIQQVELNRYHILTSDLISPVDAHFQHTRNRKTKHQKQMMQAVDHLVIGMGIHLARVHGRSNFAIATADNRLANILQRATSVVPNTATKLGLVETSKELGLEYRADIYPQVLNFAAAPNGQLASFFGEWPLPTSPPAKHRTKSLRPSDEKLLAKLHSRSGIGCDSLLYTPAFEAICEEFEKRTGRPVDRNEAWMAIGRVEKNRKRQGM